MSIERDIIYFSKRKGTTQDPYIDITENLYVQYDKIFLKEIPLKPYKVTVRNENNTAMVEVFTPNDLNTTNTFYVNYNVGVVYFNGFNNGQLKRVSYRGEGIILYPASRIYTESFDGTGVVETLQDYVNVVNEMRPTGNYSNTTPYKRGNIVFHNGYTYMAMEDTTGVAPPNATYWQQVFAGGLQGEKGDKGDKGDRGLDGIQGVKGDTGITLYTWVKYASTPTTGMSDSPDGKDYIGLAVNKTTPTKGNSYADYTWSYIRGTQGIQGVKGDKGEKGDTGNIENIWKGAYNSSISYGVNSLVSYNGSTYLSSQQTLGNVPTDTTYWNLFTQRGIDGAAGATNFTWVKYADTPTTGMNDSPVGKNYIGIAVNRASATKSTSYADYTWALIRGEQGIQGVKGDKGDKGDAGDIGNVWKGVYDNATTYPINSLVAYNGSTYFSIQPTTGNLPTNTAFWTLFTQKGTDGATGATNYTWIKYADTPTTGMSDLPTGKNYIGIATNRTVATESTVYTDYTWSLIRGEQGLQGLQGIQGVQGQNGANGATLHTWIKYADTPTTGMSDLPTGKDYLGIAVNKETAVKSSSYADYTWSYIRGTQGIQGVQGTQGIQGVQGIKGDAGDKGDKGDAGQSLYTWVKYASTPTTGISDSPTGKDFIGIAVNKTSAAKTENYADYNWSLIRGAQGIQGAKGETGATLYTWIRYADSPNTGMSDSPDGKSFIGVAANKTTATKSTSYADYTWSLIKGEQGVKGEKGDGGTIQLYQANVTYEARTLVIYEGLVYYSREQTLGYPPTNLTYWTPIYNGHEREVVDGGAFIRNESRIVDGGRFA